MVDPEDPPALKGVSPGDIDDWLTPNVDAGELFVLKKNTKSNLGEGKAAFDGTVRRGRNRRQVRIHPRTLLVATFLDPRKKSLGSISKPMDKKAIQDHVLMLMEDVEQKKREVAPTMDQCIDEALEDLDDDKVLF
jgi:hypothetical protein